MTNNPDQELFNQNENTTPADSQNNEGGETTQNKQEEVVSQVNNLFADQLANIKNEEGKPKYDDVPKALEALGHSQNHIKQLETDNSQLKQELETLREEVNKLGSVEDIISRLNTAKEQPEEQTTQTGLDEGAVENLVEKAIQKKRQEEVSTSNLNKVQTALVEKYGEAAKEKVSQKAAEYGISVQDFGLLAQRSPKLVLDMFNEPTGPSTSPSTSSINIPGRKEEVLERPTFEKSLLSGASSREQIEAFQKSKEYTMKRLGVQT